MASPTSASSGSSSFSLVFIPQTAPAGTLTITQPQQTATSFYKIASNEPITFGWNFTNVIASPTHLTVSAVCDNGNTYPVGPTDGIIPGTATQVVWDLQSYQDNNPSKPLAQATYTLNIFDERGPGAALKAGFMSPNSGLKFALYTPQPYTPLSSGECWSQRGLLNDLSLPLFRMDMYDLQRRNGDGLPSSVYQPCHYLFCHVLLRLPPLALVFESGLMLLLFI